jgi:hypothetical protein
MTLLTTTPSPIVCDYRELPQLDGRNVRVTDNSWNPAGSIKTCQELLRRGTVANIALGLELTRAKSSLKHCNWYPFLKKVGIDPSGATRRMRLATEYLSRSGIISKSEMTPPDIPAIDVGMKRLAENRAELHDLDKADLWSSRQAKPDIRMIGGVPTQSLFGFSLSRLSKKISNSLSMRVRKSQRIEKAETLETEANILNGWVDRMLELARQCFAMAQEIRDDLQKDEASRQERKRPKDTGSENKEECNGP